MAKLHRNRPSLVGQRFGRLLVLAKVLPSNLRCSYWLCMCDCGNEIRARRDVLTRCLTQSCGCFARERSRETKLTHGRTSRENGRLRDPTYITWHSMKQRCRDSNVDNWKYYGGRGVRVCERWVSSFDNFLIDMGERPPGMTLDRINPFGDYEPGNCRWVDKTTQNNNQRRHHEAQGGRN